MATLSLAFVSLTVEINNSFVMTDIFFVRFYWDPDGLRSFSYLVQDLKCMCMVLPSLTLCFDIDSRLRAERVRKNTAVLQASLLNCFIKYMMKISCTYVVCQTNIIIIFIMNTNSVKAEVHLKLFFTAKLGLMRISRPRFK